MSSLRRLDAYLEKVFDWSRQLGRLGEGRQAPRVPLAQVFEGVFWGMACEVFGSWLARTARYLDEFVNYPTIDLPLALEPESESNRYTDKEIESAASIVPQDVEARFWTDLEHGISA